MSTAEATAERSRLLTIGAVCSRLQAEFPDISISKIRYLEDQGLLAPRRTQSGYRLFSEDDVERLETILRLQRDEFLPLRVIRQELASPSGAGKERRRKRAVRADEKPPDPDCRQERERRRELEVVVRVEVAAAEHAEKRGSKPEPRQQRRAAPACCRQETEQPEGLYRRR